MLRWSKLVINSNLLIALLLFYILPLKSQDISKEMVLVSGTKFHFIQVNRWREGLHLLPYKEGTIGDAYVEDYWVDLDSFYINIHEVTNKQYKEFSDATGYKPKWPMNFLKNWKNRKYPRGKANYPVVYIDYWDAKAYAKWAGKELPTGAQWQYAAQGTDGRLFPCGDKWDPEKANVGSNGTLPVGSYPEGASPFGVLDMIGNVAEMTDSIHDDG
ncbi:MAG: SUMF1/EgtB/PvdO family nonheme iron enzyme [Candidatus Marinimicrobia bacterium]|nr:SUMF1/EgtB/PvdO family nonheme iron enzyme [Candidatus Neomarinimicrobiota bacterium]